MTTVLSTERLRLRQFRKDDEARIRALAGDRDVALMTRTIPHPYPEQAAIGWLERTGSLIEQGALRQHAITKIDDGALIGCLTLQKRVATEEVAELSYWLGKPYWGRGYIPEAADAALDDAAKTFNLTSVKAAALPGNHRSIRVLEKLGFSFTGSTEAQGPNWAGTVELCTYILDLRTGCKI